MKVKTSTRYNYNLQVFHRYEAGCLSVCLCKIRPADLDWTWTDDVTSYVTTGKTIIEDFKMSWKLVQCLLALFRLAVHASCTPVEAEPLLFVSEFPAPPLALPF